MSVRADENEHDASGGDEFPEIGAQVVGVFTAAERAAQQMIEMARDEAADLHRRAQAEADALRARRRSQAEEEARRIVAEAQAEAHRIREAAQKTAWDLEEAARKRVERILEEGRVLEERVEWAREGIADVVSRLEQVSGRRRAAPPAPPEPRPDEERGADDPAERERRWPLGRGSGASA